MSISPEIRAAFVPTGRLRASINTGNPILAAPDPATGLAQGVSVDLAKGFAERLGVELELVIFDTAGKSVDAVTQESADIGFFAIDPKHGEGIHFTGPYVLIEGCSPRWSRSTAPVPALSWARAAPTTCSSAAS